MLIIKDDIYKYKTYKRLMIKAKVDKIQTSAKIEKYFNKPIKNDDK